MQEVNPLAEKDKKEKKVKDKATEKKEGKLVTKESICATIAMFLLLVFFILCSYDKVFGELGKSVCDFLTGAFGYFVYPMVLGGVYLSVMGLFGKSLVKNKAAGFCVVATIVCIGLIVHTALTYGLPLNGYLSACFNVKSLGDATVMGWVGGLLVFGVAKIANKLGALIFFALLAAFFIYLCVVFVLRAKKKAQTEASESKEETQPQPVVQSIEQNINAQQGMDANGQAPIYAQAPIAEPQSPPSFGNVYSNGYAMPKVNQRPGVSLSEEQAAPENAFSPFGKPQAMQEKPESPNYENSRDILSSTPAEIYRKNLLFDPNANVNRRGPIETSSAIGGTSGVAPSYSEVYQNSMNETPSAARPAKIVTDNTSNYGNDYREPTPITPVQPIEDTPVRSYSFEERQSEPEVETYRSVESDREEISIMREDPSDVQVEETRGREDGGEYRRHDYMNLFSLENPNVFGPAENEPMEARGEERGRGEDPIFENDRSDRNRFDEIEERDGRDGINLLDDDEDDDTYSLRSDFGERGSDRMESAPRNEISDSPRMGFGREESSRSDEDIFTDRESDRDMGRDRAFVDPTPAPVEPIRPVQPVKPVEEAKPTPPPPPKPRIIRPYVKVPLDDFDCRDIEPTQNMEEVEETKANIIATLEDFKVTGVSVASVTFGPTVTRYNITIPRNISPKKVVALDQSIAISLHSSGVNVYPNYEDGVVSIEVPNKERQFVQLGCMLTGDTFVNAKSSSLMFTMGKDVANRKVYGDISKMIHLLVAGSSGSGKSVFLGSLIISLIYKYSPEELRLILIDPKKTEFVLYNDLPHLMINEIITDAHKAVQSLNWAIMEMNRRYGLFEQMSRAGTYVVNLDQYNAQLEKSKRLPKIVIIIDELADLMLAAKKEMEDRIQNLTQKARAAGIHLIVATQRPSTDVITGVIKSNLPTRIAFYVATDVDSRVILDQSGAQKLLGKGDLVYTMPGLAAPVRVQSAFISPEDSQKVVNFIKNNNEAYYDEEATMFINNRGGNGGDDSSGGGGENELDPLFVDALRYAILSGSASISMIQRKCAAGYNRSGKIIEQMEEMGYISPFDGAKARKVLITKEEFESKYGPLQ